jgi:inhibitor of cysteine peptidase
MATHKVNLDHDGKEVIINDGDTIVIELPENPTTGYMWYLSEVSTEGITEKSNHYFSSNTAIGSGGIRTFEFVLKKGKNGNITLHNMRKWSNDIYQTFQLRYTFE